MDPSILGDLSGAIDPGAFTPVDMGAGAAASSGGGGWQTLADALAGGISAYADAQAAHVYATTQPTPRTPWGVAGLGNYGTAGNRGGISPMLLIAGVAIIAVLLLRR